MEAEYADGDAEMGAELDDLLASDSDDDDHDDDQQKEDDVATRQPSSTADVLVDELDEGLDEDDEDLNLATELPDIAPPEAPPVEEGYAVEEGYMPQGPERFLSVYERHADPSTIFAPPDHYAPPYGDEGPSGYPPDEGHGEPYHDHDSRGGYHEAGAFTDGRGYTPRQEAQPITSRQERIAADEQLQQRNMQIFKAMAPEQLSRYEAYRRSLCPAPKVKKLMQHIMGANVVIHPQLVLAMRGVAKMYVGEIIECARQVASDMGHKGPLLPCHVQRAYGILESTNRVPRRDGPRSKLRL